MNILTLALITSALAGAGPVPGNARPATAGDSSTATPATAPATRAPVDADAGVGGPEEDAGTLTPSLDGPGAAPTIVVEGLRDPEAADFMIAPDRR